MTNYASATTSASTSGPAPVSEVYDDFTAPGGYTLDDYTKRWATPFGVGEMALSDTREFGAEGFTVSAIPFRTSSDQSVFDHLKYFATSTRSFPVPHVGSVQFTSCIRAITPGTEAGRVVRGTYIRSGEPYSAPTREAQQATAIMNMIDFGTGQLFDWCMAGTTAYALIERLPSVVTGNANDPASPRWVGRDAMYTQIVAELPLGPGAHEVGIRFGRDAETGWADWYLDGELVCHVDHVGVPLDVQGAPFTGTYPSLGPGEEVGPEVTNLTIGHGLFSTLDAFPFQHPEAPEHAVTIPLEERLRGQGAAATFGGFRVDTLTA